MIEYKTISQLDHFIAKKPPRSLKRDIGESKESGGQPDSSDGETSAKKCKMGKLTEEKADQKEVVTIWLYN